MPAGKTDWDKGGIQSCWQKTTVLNSLGLFSPSKVLHIWCSSQLPEQCWQFMNYHPRIYCISIWQMYLFFFFTSSFQLLLWQCCPYVVVMLRYKNISVWVRKRSHFCFLRLWKIVPTSCQNHMVLHCRSPWQKYPVMLQPQAHLCSLYMRKWIS